MMKINKSKIFLATVILATLPLGAEEPSLKKVRELIAEKKTEAAMEMLRADSRHILKSEKNIKDVAQWFSLFLYEESMAIFERAIDQFDKDPEKSAAEFRQLLLKEPHNKRVLQNFIVLLLDQKKYKEAKELIDRARSQFPYLYMYELYSQYLMAMEGTPLTVSPQCERRGLSELEEDFCRLLRTTANWSESKAATSSERRAILTKNRLPEAKYWLWKSSQEENHLKSYALECERLSEKDKKNYRIIPGVCAKMAEVQNTLKPAETDEQNTP